MSTLEIRDLHASVGNKKILHGVNLKISSGEVHAVMGPNGAGKSTLSAVVMGRQGYSISSGSVLLDGVEMLGLPTWQRAVAGLHLVLQYPTEVPGVMLNDVLSEALKGRGRDGDIARLDTLLKTEAERIHFDEKFLDRPLNVDLSGGEKKRNETLQLSILKPLFVILDELDSGLDVDALRDCARRVMDATEQDGLGALVITHYSRVLAELRPSKIHILVKGRIVETGGPELADVLERDGYAAFTTEETVEDASTSDPMGLNLFP
jgi:Fe-S cluster assembly ATP-binding protein